MLLMEKYGKFCNKMFIVWILPQGGEQSIDCQGEEEKDVGDAAANGIGRRQHQNLSKKER